MRIAVQGCCHGELAKVLGKAAKIHKTRPLDLLIILGDVQTVRGHMDLKSMSVPDKFKRIGDYPSYYNNSERIKAPCMTIMIGGNHESMRYLMQLPFGGWVGRNIYYMGYSGSIYYRGLRIVGLSGIYMEHSFHKKRLSWDELENNQMWGIRGLYHVRDTDVAPLKTLTGDIDCVLSHDWPSKIVYHGNMKRLLKLKPWFSADIQKGELGSPVNDELLNLLEPQYWFSAHLHVKYEACVKHDNKKDLKVEESNFNEIQLDLESDSDTKIVKLTNEVSLDIEDVKNPNEIDLDIDSDTESSSNPEKIILDIKPDNEDVNNPNVFDPEMHLDTERISNPNEIDLDINSDTENVSNPNEIGLDIKLDNESISNPDAINLDLDLDSESDKEINNHIKPQENNNIIKETNFLALDKCLPNREHMQVVEIEPLNKKLKTKTSHFKLYYDPEYIWALNNHDMKKEDFVNDAFENMYKFAVPNYKYGIQKRVKIHTYNFMKKYLTDEYTINAKISRIAKYVKKTHRKLAKIESSIDKALYAKRQQEKLEKPVDNAESQDSTKDNTTSPY